MLNKHIEHVGGMPAIKKKPKRTFEGDQSTIEFCKDRFKKSIKKAMEKGKL